MRYLSVKFLDYRNPTFNPKHFFPFNGFTIHTIYCQKCSLTHPNNWLHIALCSNHFIYTYIKSIPRQTDCFYKYFWKNRPLSGAQWISSWYSDRMLPVPRIQLTFLTTKYSKVWFGKTWLAWTESRPQFERTPLGWIRAGIVGARTSRPTLASNLTMHSWCTC